MNSALVDELGDPSVLSTTARPDPERGPDELLVDVAAAGVNFADLAKRRGAYPGGPRPPYTPGVEVAGRVAESDAEADFAVGDRVMAYVRRGGYAERTTADSERSFRVPDALSLVEAAAVPIQWLTAHNALFEWGALAGDDRVLVLAGAGGVGSAAVQLAGAAAAEVLATASTAEKRAFARDLGADRAIDYADAGLADAVEAHTDGAGVDLVLDGVGGDAFEASLDVLAPGGRVVTYGVASGEVPSVSTTRLLFENRSVVGYHLGEAADREPARVFGAMADVRERIAAGAVEIHVDRTFPLAAAADAHRYVADRRTTGAVVLDVS
jgi:NADPH2:quinone reductase